MLFYQQVQYLKFLSPYLENFKDKGNGTYVCRCPICGDSKKDKNKARGYFFQNKDSLIYKCHNCGASTSFVNFVKTNFPVQYQEMLKEMIKESPNRKKEESNNTNILVESGFTKDNARLIKNRRKINEKVGDSMLLSSMPEDNPCVQYMHNRGLGDYLNLFYYVPNVREFTTSLINYPKPINIDSYAIGIPYWNKNKTRLEYMQLRLINQGERFRYVTLKVDASDITPKLFGVERLDNNKKIITLTEGAFDSVFLDNSVAIGGLSDWRQAEILMEGKYELRFVVDNDWRYNKDVKKILKDIIKRGHKVVLFPKSYSDVKDINDIYKSGYTRQQINELCDSYTYQGMSAMLMMGR